MGLGPRSWKRPAVLTRLGRRFRRLVHIQVPELWTWRNRRIIYSRKVERDRNTEVSYHRSLASIPSEPYQTDTPDGGGKPWIPDSKWARNSLRFPAHKDTNNQTQRP